MRFCVILGIANKLIKSNLQDMYQSILINIENSYIFLNGSKLNMGCCRVQYLVLYFFILYINNLSKIISDKSNPILFADDMSINIKNSNSLAFRNNINEVFREINEWFQSNLLSLNYDKTYCFAVCN